MASVDESGGAHVVLVEDDPSQRLLFGRWLELAGWQVTAFETAESCLDRIDSLLPDVVCLDLHLPGMDGHEALAKLKTQYPSVPVLVITGDSDIGTVVESMRRGGHDFLVKPVDRARLETQVRNAISHARLSLRVAHLEREAGVVSYPGIIGTSRPMRRLYRQIDRIAASPVTVLIRGESGTGKELVAQTIHDNSANRDGPVVAINCAAIPESLQESELFGHEKGAFTGADKAKIGRFEEADGGTLFLDEVAELSPSLQAKLLRVLQERSFRRVGGRRDLTSRFRLIAASHADLHQMVAEGKFREDLFYRLAVFELDVPALRERSEDIAALAHHFLSDHRLVGERTGCTLSREALEWLWAYDWPGNVRELANALQRAAVVARGQQIEPGDLPPRIRASVSRASAPQAAGSKPVGSVPRSSAPESTLSRSAHGLGHGPASVDLGGIGDVPPIDRKSELGRMGPDGGGTGSFGAGNLGAGSLGPGSFDPDRLDSSSLDARADDFGHGAEPRQGPEHELQQFFESGPSLESIEALAIERALARHRSNVSAVARELGIGRNTLYRKMQKYDLGQRTE